MLNIYKITSSPVVDFAAEELKKYLRMMMPRAGEMPISYAPDAKDGFRLGVMAEFGIPTTEAKNLELDDIIHIDTDTNGGIIAGSNPRSVLLAVYQYLRQNGCRWLFPGLDGEYIPICDIKPVKYHKMPDKRLRAQCNEGAETQQSMLDTIDFTPKIGMNAYMIEFDIPFTYYNKYYDHSFNPAREKEPVTPDTVLQWKRVTEVEMTKRGLMMYDMGHGWTAEAFGISSVGGWVQDFDNPIPEETRKYIALLKGKRELCNGVALNTQFCMSNPEARKIVVDYILSYARTSTNVHCLKIGLADWQQNHCECDECRKKRPSDWLCVLLNEVEAEMTKEGLPQVLGFSVYSDTTWEPLETKLNHPERFHGYLCPISRNYLEPPTVHPTVAEKDLTPYIRNVSSRLDSLDEYLYRGELWKKATGANFGVYEYHFWKEQFYNPSCLTLAARLNEDVIAYHKNGYDGVMQDCSQRNFFPNALAFNAYAETLYDLDTDLDAFTDDYFTHAYGDAKDIVKTFFVELEKVFPHKFVETVHSKPVDIAHYHDASMIPNLKAAIALCDKLDEDLKPYRNMPYRVQTVAIRLLGYYTEYLRGLAQAFAIKAEGKDAEAKEFFNSFFNEFGKKEIEIEKYYDQHMVFTAFNPIFNSSINIEQ